MKSRDLYPGVFSRHAAAYKARLDDVMARGEARGRLRMLELAGARPGMRVLDLACGPGTMTRLLAAQVRPHGVVVGVDLARGMIDLARHDASGDSHFALMDMESLGFRDSTFDGAVCGHGLQFTSDLVRALREARRVLRPSAAFAASVPARPHVSGVWEIIDRAVDRFLPPGPEAIDDQATRATVSDPDALRAAAIDAGFATARVEAVDEEVVWGTAEELVSKFTGWWECAARIEILEPEVREQFMAEAIADVKRAHPGAITTHGRNLVLLARTT